MHLKHTHRNFRQEYSCDPALLARLADTRGLWYETEDGMRAGLEAAAARRQAKSVQLQDAEKALNSQKEAGIMLRSRLEAWKRLGKRSCSCTGCAVKCDGD